MLLDNVKETVKRYGLFSEGEKILIAYSGGPDSTALLHLLVELREAWSLTLSLAHFNHRLRRSAEKDELFARNTAEKLSLPLHVGSEDVRSHARRLKLNIEEAGRELRYAFFKETARKTGNTKIATGHTMDDQAETFFMRLFRGSGLAGLSGISPILDGIFIRPLIRTERKEIEAYLEKIRADFRLDETNLDQRFLRNRVRLELLPQIRQEFDPHIVSRVGKLSDILREEEKVLKDMSAGQARQAVTRKEGQAFLDRRCLSGLPVGLARRVMRTFIAEIKGDLRTISFEDVETLLELPEGREHSLKGGLLVRREGDKIFRKNAAPKPPVFNLSWSGEEPLVIKELDLRFSMEGKSALPKDKRIDNRKEAYLDREKLRFPLTVRLRQDGDRYRPLGAPGRKKLKEILRAKKIPVEKRDRLPVFLSAGKIVWVCGLPVAEEFKVTPKTEDVFVITAAG